tara:strand:+ start:244 stop:510 length:267 start_codon:yes stop_codon:yes gene_type:complete
MTTTEVLTEVKRRLVGCNVVATEEEAQSFIDSLGSEWEITEDLISKFDEMDDIVDLYIRSLREEMEKKYRIGTTQDKIEFVTKYIKIA